MVEINAHEAVRSGSSNSSPSTIPAMASSHGVRMMRRRSERFGSPARAVASSKASWLAFGNRSVKRVVVEEAIRAICVHTVDTASKKRQAIDGGSRIGRERSGDGKSLARQIATVCHGLARQVLTKLRFLGSILEVVQFIGKDLASHAFG